MLRTKQVTVIGAGIAGASAADQLARWGIHVALIEKATRAGGHAAQLSCKAVQGCVQCGACLIQDRLQRIARQPNIALMTGTRIVGIQTGQGYEIHFSACDSNSPKAQGALHADALLLTVGFAPYDPTAKPYGYGRFANVITSLEAERILRAQGRLVRPLDGQPPGRVAFIQCAGSRDSRIGHNWCSKICCGSALRMSRLIQSRQPDTAVTFFYIDVQSFGRSFQTHYGECRELVQTVRAIPGDIFPSENDSLQLTYFDPVAAKQVDQIFDLIILSVGWTPSADLAELASMAGSAAWLKAGAHAAEPPAGLFAAGAALGPMSIAESIDSAGKAAADIVNYLSGSKDAHAPEIRQG